jgi:hypothetical protein
MELNQSKCGVLHLTRPREPTITQYTVLGTPVNRPNSQKDLGMSITGDLKWNKQVQEISSKPEGQQDAGFREANSIHDW